MNERAAFDMDEGVVLFAHGAGSNTASFDRKAIARLLGRFSREKGLSSTERAQVRAWVESLPWDDDVLELFFGF